MQQQAHNQSPVFVTEPISGEHCGGRSLPNPWWTKLRVTTLFSSSHPILGPASIIKLIPADSSTHKGLYLLGEVSPQMLSSREGLSIVLRGPEMGTSPYCQCCLSTIVFSRVLILVQMSQEMGSPFLQRDWALHTTTILTFSTLAATCRKDLK